DQWHRCSVCFGREGIGRDIFGYSRAGCGVVRAGEIVASVGSGAFLLPMTAKDRKQIKVFVVLIVILGATAYLSLRTNLPSSASTSAVTTPADIKNDLKNDGGDARIRLDLMKQAGDNGEIGVNDLFEYRLGQPVRKGSGGAPPQQAST